MRCTDQLIRVTALYCEATRLSRSRVSTIVFNDGKKIDLIEAGADLSTGRFEMAMAWFSANWPADTAWPNDIPRPAAHTTAPTHATGA